MKDTLKNLLDISDHDIQRLQAIARKKVAKRKEVLFQPNRSSNKMVFIEQGLLRGYKVIDGKDYTHHFYTSNWFATDFESFLTQKPGQLYIEALEETQYLEFHKNQLEELYKESHSIERLGRIIAEKAFLATVKKQSNMQLLYLNERFERFIKEHPSLIQRVPQKHIASFLGVSEQSISRIKKQIIS